MDRTSNLIENFLPKRSFKVIIVLDKKSIEYTLHKVVLEINILQK